MNLYRTGASGAKIGLAAAVIVIIVAAGAYFAFGLGGGSPATTTTESTATTTVTPPPTTATIATTTTTSTYLGAATVNGGGSTLVFPIMSEWTFGFTQVQPNVQVNYASIGSGAGIAQITAGTLNFGASDAPLSAAQYAALPSGSTLLTIPESDSAVVPAYNIPGISSTTHLNFTGNVLAEIFLGNITRWNDPAIAALNPSVPLPAQPITVVHRSDGSGTMYAFTNYLSDSNGEWKTKVGYATSVNWPTGIGCKGNEGVAGCIANSQYSIGPLEVAYQITNPGTINYGAVQNAAGRYILANLSNIAEAVNAGVKVGLPASSAHWTGFSIVNNIFNDTADPYIYPITTFTYLLVYQNLGASYAGTTQAQATATVNFISWVINSGQKAGVSIGYPALPASVISIDNAALASITYNGTPVLSGP
jgi:phosphate transport system substrate-binding protein